jgi:hypothetical protein
LCMSGTKASFALPKRQTSEHGHKNLIYIVLLI